MLKDEALKASSSSSQLLSESFEGKVETAGELQARAGDSETERSKIEAESTAEDYNDNVIPKDIDDEGSSERCTEDNLTTANCPQSLVVVELEAASSRVIETSSDDPLSSSAVNFKPIPELQSTVVEDSQQLRTIEFQTEKQLLAETGSESGEKLSETVGEKSPKVKDEFMAPLPEISKWERDEPAEKVEDSAVVGEGEEQDNDSDDSKPREKVVTSEVLKRAENAIFQKAINAIRPIEIKKISESRKSLYQNPEPKILEVETKEATIVVKEAKEPTAKEARKSVNVTINVGRNERNVELAVEPTKKAKLDRSKFKPLAVESSHSPTRISVKERLGDKVEDDKEQDLSPVSRSFMEKREGKESSRLGRRISPLMERRMEMGSSMNPDRKVFVDDKKRMDISMRLGKIDKKASAADRERKGKTPPLAGVGHKHEESVGREAPPLKRKGAGEVDESERKRERRSTKDEKKRKKDRSRSKSKEHKRHRNKDKKHKRDKERSLEKRQKHREAAAKEKQQPTAEQVESAAAATTAAVDGVKKPRKNPRLVSDRKRSVLDESNFEPDYSASESESEAEEGTLTTKPVTTSPRKSKDDEEKEPEQRAQPRKRARSASSSEDESSSSSSSSESSSDEEVHKKRKKKHKKHKRKKSAKKSSSDSDSASESDSESSSEEERHRKKKKSKSRKQSKKKKKGKHK